MILEVKNINKSFDGKHILKDVSFKVVSNRAMGFLGRNGAGKTTTIRTLMNVFEADSGQILLDGKEFVRKNQKVGYLPEERGMYGKIKILDQLAYFGQLKGMDKKTAKESALKWLAYMDLEDRARDNMDTLSKGNQQKVQIIQAIIDNPDILILDEPFSGLDPVNSQVLKNLIHDFIEAGKLVIFSSHQMGYVEEFCDDISLIKNGEIILSGNLDKIKKDYGKNKYRVRVKEREIFLSKIESLSWLKYSEDKSSFIVDLDNRPANDLLAYLIGEDMTIELFSSYEPSLEEIFVMEDRLYEEERWETLR